MGLRLRKGYVVQVTDAKSSNNLSCDLCKTVMELLDAYISDEVTEQQVYNLIT